LSHDAIREVESGKWASVLDEKLSLLQQEPKTSVREGSDPVILLYKPSQGGFAIS